jgi:phospholipase C
MSFATRILLLFVSVSLGATYAAAQTLPHFSHIIIVVQENRTPDDLFGANLNFESGVDLAGGGYGIFVRGGQTIYQFIQDSPRDLSGCAMNNGMTNCVDPSHSHASWVTDYDDGNMDGFCHQTAQTGQCPQYSYVPQTDVQPYFDIATNYGFANYFFQTNEGPSFEAHQFLFSGTSAPVSPGQTFSQYFVAENPFSDRNGNSGCPYSGTRIPDWAHTDATDFTDPRHPPSECYPHDTLVTNSSGDKGVTWGYYTPSVPAYWNAPEALSEVCVLQYDSAGNPYCGGPEWSHVQVADQNGHSDAPIFDDLLNCNLPAISWVIPDRIWSDHAVSSGPYGPSFVGDIVDAVGGGMSGSTCNPPSTTNAKYWKQEPTAIFILWDDWGGWFDHVQPWAVYRNPSDPTLCPAGSAPNGWGCGYTSGFRVPLLVVSPYFTTAGYVSGACGAPPLHSCPNKGTNNAYVHDFGSILAFTEQNFGLPLIDGTDKVYADYNAPDWGTQRTNVPLSDFFGSTQQTFTPINTLEPYSCFRDYASCTGTPFTPTGPDDDSD